MTVDTQPVSTPVSAAMVVAAIADVGATHVVTVPDTHQKTVMEALDEGDIPIVRAATEDDVLAICAGLWMAGATPVALIQQLGLFAAANALRAFTHDQHVPLAIVAGLYGRDVTRDLHDAQPSAVRLCVPLLDALEIDCVLVERVEQAHLIGPGLAEAFSSSRTSVVLLGAPTS